ncbi:GGDEF domain-containing protein [Actinoplanes sp. NBRC 14428]|nr:GGDEF domain-containing protein [Actinoplanes sp. NBRC 14428]
MTTALVVAFGVAAVTAATVAVSGLRSSRAGSAILPIVAFMGAGVALINALSAVQLLVPDRTTVWVVGSVQAVVSPLVMASVSCMALALSDRAWRLSRRTALLLLAEPVLILGAVVTDPWLHLHFTGVEPTGWNGMLLTVPGPTFWLNVFYIQALIVGTVARVVVLIRRSTSAGQRRISLLVLGTYVPCTVIALVTPALPVTLIDLIPLGQAICMVYIQLVLAGGLPQFIPIAHRHIFATMSDGVMVIDRETRIIEVNPAARRIYHRLVPDLPADVTGLPVDAGIPLRLDELRATEQTVNGPRDTGIDLHVQITPLHDRRGRCLGWALVARDITELNLRRRQAERAASELREQLATIEALRADLAEQATRDVLTGLRNRRYLMDRLREAPPASLALLDLDHFKQINDTYGHAVGDTVLAAFARLLEAGAGPHAVVARYGGEEFVVAFTGADAETARCRIDALREQVARIDTGLPLTVTFSAGIAGAAGGSAEDLLRRADDALYEAKRCGRNRVEPATAPPMVGTY